MKTKTFVLIGAAGYVAPKHFRAIKKNGGELLAVIDPVENLDVLDEYFPEAEYFRSIKEAENFIKNNRIDFCVICSPTHLHAEHIRFGLKSGCNVICESPLVLSPTEIEQIKLWESETGNKVFNLLQYRYDPAIRQLLQEFDNEKHYNIRFQNYSYRGKWLQHSWKGDDQKTGGLMTVLGYHFFDAFIWIFGEPFTLTKAEVSQNHCTGTLELDHATVQFELRNDKQQKEKKNILFLTVDGQTIELSEDDHFLFVNTYHEILKDKGVRTRDLLSLVKLLNKTMISY